MGTSVAICWAGAITGTGLGCVATNAWAGDLGRTVATLSASKASFATNIAVSGGSFAVAALRLTVAGWAEAAWAKRGASPTVSSVGACVAVAFAVGTVLSNGAGLFSLTQIADTLKVSRALKATKAFELASLSLLTEASQTISVLNVLDTTWDDLLVALLLTTTEKATRS